MDPVLTQTTGRFHRRAPARLLQGSFASVWVHQMDPTGAPPLIITPDATIDLQWIGGSFRVAGPDRDPQIETLAAGEVVIGFRFRPAAASRWLGVPIMELVGQRLSLEDLWGKRARRLASHIHVSDHLEDLLSSLETVLADEGLSNEPNTPMRAAHDLIDRGVPPEAPLVPWLMRALEMSERTLRRRFDESFGYGPKTLDRILRYQRFLRLLSQSRGATAILASEAGYSDQAHLVRESRRLTGSTPRQVDRLLSGAQT